MRIRERLFSKGLEFIQWKNDVTVPDFSQDEEEWKVSCKINVCKARADCVVGEPDVMKSK